MIETSSGQPQEIERAIRWKRGEILGQGAFGIVYLGLNTDNGELMAVKQMAIEDVSSKYILQLLSLPSTRFIDARRRELKSLQNEINLLKGLQHPNIVRYIGTEINPTALSIFLVSLASLFY